MKKQVVRLTESDLNKIIAESVQQILKENPENEGLWDRMKGMFGKVGGDAKQGVTNAANNISNKAQQGWNAGKQMAKQVGNNVAQTYNNAKQSVQNYANDVKQAGQMASNKADAQQAIKTIQGLVQKGILGKNIGNMVIGNLRKYGNQ